MAESLTIDEASHLSTIDDTIPCLVTTQQQLYNIQSPTSSSSQNNLETNTTLLIMINQ